MSSTIVLHGALRKRFGGPFDLSVKTPAEAIRALTMMKPGFGQALREGQWRVIRANGRKVRDSGLSEIHMNISRQLHIVPALEGAGGKGGGAAKVVVGVALLAVAVVSFGAGAGLLAADVGAGIGVGTVGISVGATALMGASLLFSGISTLLSPTPKSTTNPATNASYLLSGLSNVTAQGVPVPLTFGRSMVGSVVIGTSVDVQDVPTSA